MTHAVTWHPRALRDLRRLDRQVADRVLVAIERYAETAQGDVRVLTGVTPPTWRLRVGDWRVLFEYQDADVLHVLRVQPRGRAYR